MESSQLPLLHKYVLSPQDDLQLQMTKLRYRLCVREVHDVLARKSCPAEFAHLRESSDSDESDAGQEADDESEDSDHYDDDLESPIMADTAFEVNAAPDIGGDGPQCMSSPIEDKDGNYPTMKSDDSGIIMDMSSYSINESLSEPASPAAGSPNTEVIMNGHAEEHTDTPGGHSDTMITDLVNAMDGGSSPVPQITIDTVPDNKHSDDNEESTLQESTETTESTDQSQDESTEDKQEVSAEVEEDEMSESEEESESDEEDRVEFKRGIRCSDVNHALEILKTKYKLTPAVPKPKGKPRKPDRKSPTYHTLPRAKTRDASTLPAKRVSQPCRSSIITWSCWNISDIVHPLNNRASWLPVAPADTKPTEDGTDHDENANMRNMNKNIDSKAEEIEKLLKQRTAEEEEQKKKEQQERLKEEPAVVQEDKVEPIVEAPIEASKAPEAQAEPPKKKKKGNLWQRMVRAMRKRLGGNNRNRQQNAAKA